MPSSRRCSSAECGRCSGSRPSSSSRGRCSRRSAAESTGPATRRSRMLEPSENPSGRARRNRWGAPPRRARHGSGRSPTLSRRDRRPTVAQRFSSPPRPEPGERSVHVIGGSASTALAERVSRELGNAPFAIPFVKRFPDGELYVRIGGRLTNEDVVLVQSTRSDQDLIELFLLEDAIREAGARRLTVVVPYFGYARQDRSFFPGEPISARVLARHIEQDADAVVTVDLHSPSTRSVFAKPAFEASGIPAIARLLRERPVDLLVSPDKGGVERVRRMSELLDKPWLALEKKRIDSEHVELALPEHLPLELEGKHV